MNRRILTLVFAAVGLCFASAMPVAAAQITVLERPTADVLGAGGVQLYGRWGTAQRAAEVSLGLPAGFQLDVTGHLQSSNDTITPNSLGAALRYRLVRGTLLTPAVGAGLSYDPSNGQAVPYVVATKGFLNAKLTAGVRFAQTAPGADPFFGGVDMTLLGPLHALGEYDGGTWRYGVGLSLFGVEGLAYVDGREAVLGGRVQF